MKTSALDRAALQQQMDRYHSAIARGRHPVSFSRSVQPIWKFVQTSEDVRKKMLAGHLLSVTATEVHAPSLASPAKEVEQFGSNGAVSSPIAPVTPPRAPHPSFAGVSPVATPAPPATDKTTRSSAIRNPMLTSQTKPAPVSPDAHHSNALDASRVATPVPVSALSLLKSKTTSSLPASALATAYISGSSARATQQTMGSPASRLKGSAVHAAASSMLFAAKSKVTHKYLAPTAETPVTYGCTVALQHIDGRFLTLKVSTGELTLETPPDPRWFDRRVMPFKESKLSKYQFPLVDLEDLRNTRFVNYGDPIWITLIEGRGETNYQSGSVMGPEVRAAVPFGTKLSVFDAEAGKDLEKLSETGPGHRYVPTNIPPVVAGRPKPVVAFVPSANEDWLEGIPSATNQNGHYRPSDPVYPALYSRCNLRTRQTARWTTVDPRQTHVTPAAAAAAGPVPLGSSQEVALNQDWFYLSSTQGGHAALQSSPNKQHPLSPYTLDRPCVWRIHVVCKVSKGQDSAVAAKAARSESLTMRARDQLQRSSDLRAGVLPSSQYGDELSGGSGFPDRLRKVRKNHAVDIDSQYLAHEADKLQDALEYFSHRWHSKDTKGDEGGEQLALANFGDRSLSPPVGEHQSSPGSKASKPTTTVGAVSQRRATLASLATSADTEGGSEVISESGVVIVGATTGKLGKGRGCAVCFGKSFDLCKETEVIRCHHVAAYQRKQALDAANAEAAKAAEKERASSTAAASQASSMFAVTPLLASRARSSISRGRQLPLVKPDTSHSRREDTADGELPARTSHSTTGRRRKQTALDVFLAGNAATKASFTTLMSQIDSGIRDEMETVDRLERMRRMYNALPPQGESLDDQLVIGTGRRRSVTSNAIFVPDDDGIFAGAEDIGDSVSVRASPVASTESN